MDGGNETWSLSIRPRSSAAAGSESSVVEASARRMGVGGEDCYPGNFTRFRDVGSGGDPALADRVADEVRRVVHVQLLHQTTAMEFGGFHADMQHFGDLLGRSPFADELQYLAFPGGEIRTVVAGIVWRS